AEASPAATTPLLSSTPAPSLTPTLDARVGAAYRELFRQAAMPDIVRIYSAGFITQLAFRSADRYAEELWAGEDPHGDRIGLVVFRESGLQAFCEQQPDYCEGTHFRLASVDFRPDGVIVFGNLRLGDIWSPDIGVALMLHPERLALTPVGLVWDHTLYSFPPAGPIADAAADLFGRGSQAFAQLEVYMDDEAFHLSEMRLTDDDMVLFLRAGAPADNERAATASP
ncbi:MAG: hypothetical protein JW910_04510, partial [Anaerolineae bacterium]|nr:hypothetical protein [Anaerolineae bacterium]